MHNTGSSHRPAAAFGDPMISVSGTYQIAEKDMNSGRSRYGIPASESGEAWYLEADNAIHISKTRDFKENMNTGHSIYRQYIAIQSSVIYKEPWNF